MNLEKIISKIYPQLGHIRVTMDMNQKIMVHQIYMDSQNKICVKNYLLKNIDPKNPNIQDIRYQIQKQIVDNL